MEKRYQIFVSSTYADLKEERRKIIQTLMEMDCIPSGMEMFPAADEEQWEFIKKIIDDCDYYMLLIGGRYGSTTSDGISYTEKEYDYANEKGLKILAFLHQEPDIIPAGKTEKSQEALEKLQNFREKVQTGRLVKYWKSTEELPGLVALSLSKTIKTYPALGWVRATNTSSTELLEEINLLRKENSDLKSREPHPKKNVGIKIENLANLEETTTLHGTYKKVANGTNYPWQNSSQWAQIFAFIAPHLLEHPNDATVKVLIKDGAIQGAGIAPYSSTLDDQTFQTIKVQLMAYGIVTVNYSQTVKGGMALFWGLTEKGRELMMQLRTKKSEKTV